MTGLARSHVTSNWASGLSVVRFVAANVALNVSGWVPSLTKPTAEALNAVAGLPVTLPLTVQSAYVTPGLAGVPPCTITWSLLTAGLVVLSSSRATKPTALEGSGTLPVGSNAYRIIHTPLVGPASAPTTY